jgi:hypothetical protein
MSGRRRHEVGSTFDEAFAVIVPSAVNGERRIARGVDATQAVSIASASSDAANGICRRRRVRVAFSTAGDRSAGSHLVDLQAMMRPTRSGRRRRLPA